jgi:molecular chaperone HtpG
MDVQIPEKLEDILKRDQKLHAALILSIAEFEPWLRLSGSPFFPEYTDHGPKHLTETLDTCCAITRDDAWPTITPQDAGALILAVLLHDCAIHLTEDGFVSLITQENRPLVPSLGDKPWPGIWMDYLGEASRFDAKKLIALFGDPEPIHNPGLDPKKWTMRDMLLIGEFLRHHHPRLAHEVALWGVPGPASKPLALKEISQDFADIAGFVARSHGRSIRSCLAYLLQRNALREFRGIHAVFLMTVVRVADYMQVQPERAPRQILRVRQLRSPISQGEWNVHEAVRELRYVHEDPEAIFVDAMPKSVKTYFKLRGLLSGIQSEMDASWAVLGEVYGRYSEGLNKLGLKFRRVRSNMEDEQELAKFLTFLPYEATFGAAEGDLLKLLITPLYGDRPQLGIRELIQNALDACRELRDYLQQRPTLPAPDLTAQDGDVVVTLEQTEEKGTGWLVVSDRGIGMTADTILKYFLKAGASFRRSDAWRRLHEKTAGKSRVLRSGRFGVGVLASFLLGDEVQVSTRHVDAPPEGGIVFKATIDSTDMELTRCRRTVGTTIKIKILEGTWQHLTRTNDRSSIGSLSVRAQQRTGAETWDWYCLPEPPLIRKIISVKETTLLAPMHSLPLPGSDLPDHWRRISHPNYSDIQWTYDRAPRLTCNGVKILEVSPLMGDLIWSEFANIFDPSARDPLEDLWESAHLSLRCPNVSVFDPDGHLPLLLQRTGLQTREYPFQRTLFDDVIKDFLAFVLVHAPERPMNDPSHSGEYGVWYSGIAKRSQSWLPFFCLAEGASLVDPWHLRTAQFDRTVLLPSLSALPSELKTLKTNPTGGVIGFATYSGKQNLRDWFKFVLGRGKDEKFGPVARLNRAGSRILVAARTYQHFREPGMISKSFWRPVKEEFVSNDWALLRSGTCPESLLNYRKLTESSNYQLEGIGEWYLAEDRLPTEAESPFAKAWKEVIGTPVIPYDPTERRRKLSGAFDLLKDYVAAHERIKQSKKPNP